MGGKQLTVRGQTGGVPGGGCKLEKKKETMPKERGSCKKGGERSKSQKKWNSGKGGTGSERWEKEME